MTEEPTIVPPAEADVPPDTVGDAFARLYADGRAYADAEIERQKLRAGIAGAGVRDAVIFATVGVMLAFAGLVAFLVGLVLILSSHLGPAWATVAVFGSALVTALILFLLAKARISRMMKAVKS